MAKKITKLTKNAAFYLGKCIWRPLVKDFMPNHHPPSDHYPRALTISQVNEHNGSQSLWYSHYTFVRLTITLTRPLAFPQYVWICLTDECVSDHNERIRSIQIDNLGIDLILSLWSETHSSVKKIQTFSIMRVQNILQKFSSMCCAGQKWHLPWRPRFWRRERRSCWSAHSKSNTSNSGTSSESTGASHCEQTKQFSKSYLTQKRGELIVVVVKTFPEWSRGTVLNTYPEVKQSVLQCNSHKGFYRNKNPYACCIVVEFVFTGLSLHLFGLHVTSLRIGLETIRKKFKKCSTTCVSPHPFVEHSFRLRTSLLCPPILLGLNFFSFFFFVSERNGLRRMKFPSTQLSFLTAADHRISVTVSTLHAVRPLRCWASERETILTSITVHPAMSVHCMQTHSLTVGADW